MKIMKIGNSYYVSIPKPIMENLSWDVDDELNCSVDFEDSLISYKNLTKGFIKEDEFF